MSVAAAEVKTAKSAFSFKEVQAGVDGDHHVADGYNADILIRWGDPVIAEAPPLEPNSQTEQASQSSSATTTIFLAISRSRDRGAGFLR